MRERAPAELQESNPGPLAKAGQSLVLLLLVFYVFGKAGECIKSSGCQIREDYGHYRQLEFEESVGEQREKELRSWSSRSLEY